MFIHKRNEKIFTNAIKLTAFAAMGMFAACGGDSDSSAKADNADGREVATLAEMGRCTSDRNGDTVYVAEKLTDYLCQNGSWVDLSEIPDGTDLKSSSSSGTSSGDDADSTKGFVRENVSVTGVAQKGPFQFGSPLTLQELKKDLTPSGLVYNDEINSNKGDFVIPKVSLAHPYAKLEVRGLYRNEVTGNWSTDSMTLRALTDFSDKRTDANTDDRTQVNINLLTHLEYDRALYLVQEKGYSVYAAKKQAAQEIMTAFEFATAVTYSEDFAIFQNDGVGANTIAGNGTLLAISALVMGNRSDAEIQSTIDKFIADITTDGEWNDLQTKADMADWAYDFDYKTIRASVKSWNILDIPDYETYLDIYWNNVYGLGGCSEIREGVVAPNSNKLSKYYNEYFICAEVAPNSYKWKAATTFEKDTYGWHAGKEGDFEKGNVTDTIYICKDSNWVVAERETAIGLCTESKAGTVSVFDSVYYICKNNAWEKATMLEYDTYGLTGVEGDVKPGVVNKDKYYVFDNGKWRASASEIENNFGACVTSREGEKQTLNGKYYVCESKKWKQITEEEFGLGYCSEKNESVVSKLNNTYYICKSNAWTEATALEYDTYGWNAGTEGEVKTGSVNTNSYYIYKNSKWQVATGVESDLGGCISSREGEVNKSANIYYICKSKIWAEATELEYDTYGWKAGTDGELKRGGVTDKYYVFEDGEWHVYSGTVFKDLGGCVTSREGEVGMSGNTYYICKSKKWEYATALEYDTYGWDAGVDGEVKAGRVNPNYYYTYKDGKWQYATNIEEDLGGCITNREGKVSVLGNTYYICKSKTWTKATALEYDTYGWNAGSDGEVKVGSVNSDKYYIYENGAWRTSTSEIENNLGGCVASREGEVGKSGNTYYICKSKNWTTATTLQFDTYGWGAGVEGEVKAGSVNPNNYYTYKDGKWQYATNIEKDLGGCITNREGEVGKSGNTYYICKSKNWTTATVLEYDTYGKKCSRTEVGKKITGAVIDTNMYYCASIKKGSVNGFGWVRLNGGWSWNVPKEVRLNSEITYGTMTDSRDNKTYKTVVIGSQTWMAENLNYDNQDSWCYGKTDSNDSTTCDVTGRLYTWASAMDSIGLWSTSGKGCGIYAGSKCTPIYPVRGVCPADWHLPTSAEFNTLFSAVGCTTYYCKGLKSKTGWEDSANETDAFGFSALPAGYRTHDGSYKAVGSYTVFWSSTKGSSHAENIMALGSEDASLSYVFENRGFSVRCVKD